MRDEHDCTLISGYGWPCFAVRSLAARLLATAALGLWATAVRLLHPAHPYRVHTLGTVVIERELMEAARVPTQLETTPRL